jgi:ubiquinone/menaquinone biosynthesis C-methylase UbiE
VKRTHYSYAHYADTDVASGFDQLRFGGPIGQLVADEQERVLLMLAGDLAGRDVLDVGTGTGRAAFILAREGARVTGLDFSMEMMRVGADRARRERRAVGFLRGDAHGLPFPDRRFDTSVSFRVLMHTPGWRTCVQELCRVTRHRVIVDYPAFGSAASLQAAARRVKQRLGRPTEAYRVFRDRVMDEAFAEAGFRVIRRHRQFLLPIALHKAIGSRRFSEGVEGVLASAGLVGLFGSPVTILAERCAR